METTREMIQDLSVGDQIMVGYAYCDWRKRYIAHLFGKKTTATERREFGYATGTVSKIEKTRKSDRLYQGGKYLWLTIDGVPDRQLFLKWEKATVVNF